jgi:hypothetical protein
MHHTHVKYKESAMNRYSMEEFHRIPDLYIEIEQSARRERARVMRAGYAWLARAFATWLGKTKAHFGRRGSVRPSRWLARLG